MTKFQECAVCAAKSGSPILCESCLYNRQIAIDYNECYEDCIVETLRANEAEKKLDDLKPKIYLAFQYGYGYRDHPSMRGSSLAAAWTSYKEYNKK